LPAAPVTLRRFAGPVVAVVLSVAVLLLPSAWTAFTGSTTNPGSTFAAGTVTLSDNDSSDTLKLFNLAGMLPGDTATGCVKVTYSGTLPATVKLYASTGGTGFGTYIDLTVTRGTIAGANVVPDCTGFVAATANYKGAGAGVLYSGTLGAYPNSVGTGQQDLHNAAGLAEAWTTNEVHAYKFVATVQNNTAAQGLTATPTFTWAADNTTAYSQVIQSDDPASYWKLDETAGTTATDTIGAANGTYTNGPLLNQPSGVKDANTAVSFDGSNDSVQAGNVYGYSGSSSFSVEFWLNTDAPSATLWRRVISKEGTGGKGWDVYLAPTSYPPANQLSLERWNVGGTSNAVGTVAGLLAGTWYHVVLSYDGSTMRLYLNGTLNAQASSALVEVSNTGPLVIGGSSDGTNFYSGLLDEVAIYPTVLSAQQVQEHYNAGKR
jgi:hypothetical protein